MRASDPPAKAAPKSPQSKEKKKSTGAGGAAADNAREDALSFLVKEKKRKESVAADSCVPNQRLLLSELSDRGGVHFHRAQLFLERGTWYLLRSR